MYVCMYVCITALSYSNFSESICVAMFMIFSEYYMLIYLNFANKNTITQRSVQQTNFS